MTSDDSDVVPQSEREPSAADGGEARSLSTVVVLVLLACAAVFGFVQGVPQTLSVMAAMAGGDADAAWVAALVALPKVALAVSCTVWAVILLRWSGRHPGGQVRAVAWSLVGAVLTWPVAYGVLLMAFSLATYSS